MLYQVYLVDDEEIALKTLEMRIQWNAFGFEIAGKSTDPLQALEDIHRICPHVVVTDIKMPVLDGLELIRRVREKLPDVEFVAVSAHSDFHLLRGSLKLGIFDYLLKPLSWPECRTVLSQLYDKLGETYQLRESVDTGSYDGSNSKLNAILGYIEQNLEKHISLKIISERFHLSTTTVCQYFSKHLNTTFVSYLTDFRMQYAKKLLATGKSVKDISAACGYEDYFYFCRVFQGHYHCTPTQMKKQLSLEEQS